MISYEINLLSTHTTELFAMPQSVSSKLRGGKNQLEIISKMKSSQKTKPTMVTPASKRSGEGKSPRRKITGRRKKSTKFASLKMAGKWADALDGNLWIYGESEKQTQADSNVPREIIIRSAGTEN